MTKTLGWLFVIGVILLIIILFIPYRVGPVEKPLGRVILEYTGIFKDKRSNVELIKSLNSSDEAEQLNAITAMAYRSSSSDNVEALMSYLKSDKATKRMKDIAVWALGELHAQEAKEFLYSLKNDESFDQYEVNKAIKKIEGKIPKPFWRKEKKGEFYVE